MKDWQTASSARGNFCFRSTDAPIAGLRASDDDFGAGWMGFASARYCHVNVLVA